MDPTILENILTVCEEVLTCISGCVTCGIMNEDLLTPIETALELLSQIEEWCPPSLIPVCSQLVQSMVEIAQVVEDVCDVQIRRSAVDCPSESEVVEQTQLSFFIDNRFKVEEMALMLNVKLHAYGLSQRNYTVITDSQLDEVVSQVCVCYPTCGAKMMRSSLSGQGIYVQRERVRQALRRVDPLGVERRVPTNI